MITVMRHASLMEDEGRDSVAGSFSSIPEALGWVKRQEGYFSPSDFYIPGDNLLKAAETQPTQTYFRLTPEAKVVIQNLRTNDQIKEAEAAGFKIDIGLPVGAATKITFEELTEQERAELGLSEPEAPATDDKPNEGSEL